MGCLRRDLVFQSLVLGETAQHLGLLIGATKHLDGFLEVGLGAQRPGSNPGNAQGQFGP